MISLKIQSIFNKSGANAHLRVILFTVSQSCPGRHQQETAWWTFCSFFATIQNLPLAGSASLHLQLFRAAAGAARLAHLRSKFFQVIIHVLSKSSI